VELIVFLAIFAAELICWTGKIVATKTPFMVRLLDLFPVTYQKIFEKKISFGSIFEVAFHFQAIVKPALS
jgi:hypothetical protein